MACIFWMDRSFDRAVGGVLLYPEEKIQDVKLILICHYLPSHAVRIYAAAAEITTGEHICSKQIIKQH